MAPMNSIPKTILSSPSQSEIQGSPLTTASNTSSPTLSRLKFEEVIQKNKSQILEKEAHLKKLKNLKKELDHIQNTAWRYPSIEQYIGH